MRKLVLILLASLVTQVSWAKDVSISWKTIKKAAGYELRIERRGKLVRTEKASKTSWKGELPFGLYSYQIRAIDKVGRPGHWSGKQPLAVMPVAPKLVTPEDGEKFVYFNPAKRVKARWAPVPDVNAYQIEVLANDEVVFTTETTEIEVELPLKGKGSYSWQVRPVMEPGSIPDFKGKKWKGKPGDRNDFELEYRELEKPEPVAPLGQIVRAKGEELEFRWKEVPGAEAYELRFAPAQASGDQIRRPASETFRRVVTAGTRSVVDKVPDGTWYWEVRALASVDPNTQEPQVVGAESVADFDVATPVAHPDGKGYVAFSTLFSPYTYEVVSSQLQGTSQDSALAMNYRLSGEYWPEANWGAQLALNQGYMIANQQTFNRFDWDLYAKYQFALGSESSRWILQPKLGILSHQYFHLLRGAATSGFEVSERVRATGFGLGLDVRRAFTDRLSLGLKLEYFIPIGISADNGGGILYAQDSYRNVSLGVQGIYWLGGPWGLGAGMFIEKRSIGYKPISASGGRSNDPELIRMDGVYFFGSIIYSWGK